MPVPDSDEWYLATNLAMEWGTTLHEVLKVQHGDPDPEDQGMTYIRGTAPPAGHIWATDSLRWWLGSEGCKRERLEMWVWLEARKTPYFHQLPFPTGVDQVEL